MKLPSLYPGLTRVMKETVLYEKREKGASSQQPAISFTSVPPEGATFETQWNPIFRGIQAKSPTAETQQVESKIYGVGTRGGDLKIHHTSPTHQSYLVVFSSSQHANLREVAAAC